MDIDLKEIIKVYKNPIAYQYVDPEMLEYVNTFVGQKLEEYSVKEITTTEDKIWWTIVQLINFSNIEDKPIGDLLVTIFKYMNEIAEAVYSVAGGDEKFKEDINLSFSDMILFFIKELELFPGVYTDKFDKNFYEQFDNLQSRSITREIIKFYKILFKYKDNIKFYKSYVGDDIIFKCLQQIILKNSTEIDYKEYTKSFQYIYNFRTYKETNDNFVIENSNINRIICECFKHDYINIVNMLNVFEYYMDEDYASLRLVLMNASGVQLIEPEIFKKNFIFALLGFCTEEERESIYGNYPFLKVFAEDV